MHSEQAGAKQCERDGCSVLFRPKTRWQAFCSVGCRNLHHRALSPEAMRRELDQLKAQVAALTQRVSALDDPTAKA